jgi:hypothetical protein
VIALVALSAAMALGIVKWCGKSSAALAADEDPLRPLNSGYTLKKNPRLAGQWEDGVRPKPVRHSARPKKTLGGVPAAVNEPKIIESKALGAEPANISMRDFDPSMGVVIRQDKTSLVDIQVKDAKYHEIKGLYTGLLKPGEWRFQWDGRDAAEIPVVPGLYRIVVEKDKNISIKEITIQRVRK